MVTIQRSARSSSSVMAFLLYWCHTVVSKQLQDIYWNSSNPQFYESPYGLVLSAQLMDTVDIHCPHSAEFSIIYMVSKYGYDNCLLHESVPVGQCTPSTDSSIKLILRELSPLPDGLEFRPGGTYYFITTSSGSADGLHGKSEGLCKRKNLKMVLYIREQRPENVRHNQVEQKKPTDYNDWPANLFDQPSRQQERLSRLHVRTGSRIKDQWDVADVMGIDADNALSDQPNKLVNNDIVDSARFWQSPFVREPVILYEVHELSNMEPDAYRSAAWTAVCPRRTLWILLWLTTSYFFYT